MEIDGVQHALSMRPTDPLPTRTLVALRFATAHHLIGAGCDTYACAARVLVERFDATPCAALGRADVVFVSVSEACWIALHLRAAGARYTALPFDWNVLPLASVVAALRDEHGFERFLDDARFARPTTRIIVDDDHSGDDGGAEVLEGRVTVPAYSPRSGVLFVHDFESGNTTELARVRAKYARRGERLRALLAQREAHVYLITSPLSPNEWQRGVFDELGVGDVEARFGARAYTRAARELRELFDERQNVHVINESEAVALLEAAGIPAWKPGRTCL